MHDRWKLGVPIVIVLVLGFLTREAETQIRKVPESSKGGREYGDLWEKVPDPIKNYPFPEFPIPETVEMISSLAFQAGGILDKMPGRPEKTSGGALSRAAPSKPTQRNIQVLQSNRDARLKKGERPRTSVANRLTALAQDLKQAAAIQQQLLPRNPQEVPGLELSGYNQSCRNVGGDYYDYLPQPGGSIHLALGDVAGKGMPAALLMMRLQARVHLLAHAFENPTVLLDYLNEILLEEGLTGRFVSLFYSVFDPAIGTLTYCNAGHNPPLLLRRNGSFETLKTGGPVLGVLPKTSYSIGRERLQAGDLLFGYSDGLTEAFDPDEQEFGVTRLKRLLLNLQDNPLDSMRDSVIRAVKVWTAGAPQRDDITLLLARKV